MGNSEKINIEAVENARLKIHFDGLYARVACNDAIRSIKSIGDSWNSDVIVPFDKSLAFITNMEGYEEKIVELFSKFDSFLSIQVEQGYISTETVNCQLSKFFK